MYHHWRADIVDFKEILMSTNLTDEMLPFIPAHAPLAPQAPTEPDALGFANRVRQNAVSLIALVALRRRKN